tara:strand:- start:18130 stop:19095 length:966 start_codon:yes stop_codon:yes gene_type:complete
MIFGSLAIFLNLMSVMTFSVILIVTVITAIIKVRDDRPSHYSAPARCRILWLVALSPWVAGLLAAALALFSDSQYLPVSNLYSLFYWHHYDEFTFNSWHGLSMTLAVSCASFLLMKNIKRLLINCRQVWLLQAMAEPDTNKFYQLDADAPTAFTAGYIHPRCYMTTALRRQLNEQEYTIIKLHENEHARRLDPLKKWLFQTLASFFPLGASRHLNQMMVLAMEQCADAAVSRVVADKSLIAKTLLKVKRLVAAPHQSILDDRAVCHYGSDNISERIGYLLNNDKKKAFPHFRAAVSIVSMSVICVISADILHHAIEYTLFH